MRAAAALFLLFLAATVPAAKAQDRPGAFDFYVLALSWSPTYCLLEGTAADRLQCGPGRRRDFIVHGLWPQSERGYPEFCAGGPREAPPSAIRNILDIIPSENLARHEWRKHGSCSGLTPDGYFDLTRRARGRVAIPQALKGVRERTAMSPDAIERAFIAANPGLRPDAIAVGCTRQRLEEVRICLTRDLAFRACREVDRRGCRAGSLTVPPVR